MKVNKVSAYRKAIKMNQSQMAKLLNLSVDAYSRKERGLSEFKQSEMAKIVNIISKKEPTATIEAIFFN
ncbi:MULTISPECIES: helix-turn-helix transcriptional regulator [Aerococcus]|uniref:Helix-turn-helix transcriptional regulator n=1 Tax=Aerococcus sanguinicola TaxID=119206 RepID=A0A5N1GNV0_9LACT|nr:MULTISPECIES: helix-turn-helix transcriptional regulator [Aerococcus]KAA9301939.1 helix-turn-helix transcriptional regulator [Aerococcus sanguinicola]MDK6368637.1 helix-turn-helix transcriptional regulator [Aerococcus sp. UMB9870]MDK6679720.1 helix-turn-helix transcriptional regulator [Aerococcus sp. UMB8608]MDK6686008.1 helix-turn-helix transcriptional regulator [Aerococcus sp. UMB8623]MDK6940814.1 helix-turn-helix transcriptional regulator [Aerococcus sp. UMB8487]